MTREEAINELNKVFTSAYANCIVIALTEGATVSDKEPFKPMVEIDLYSVIKQSYIEREVPEKIRAEINKLTVYYTTKDKGINLISQKAVNRIFDKYKAESEGK